jgi:hypothetical protein
MQAHPAVGGIAVQGRGGHRLRPAVGDVEQPATAARDDGRHDRGLPVPQRVGRQFIEGEDQALAGGVLAVGRETHTVQAGAQAGTGSGQLAHRAEIPAPHVAPAVR